ncbi:hypothetical protein B0H66DRAFT_529213 [Apodospora peruviana]|uniref:Uncharacterized protein n=1 Tax=Apodospora peruviana TaxID=516989 RepID=A0AAE0MBP2_9PEZI|nr:hypothetical protein B0H66DRAFT_529213 [Apodospora peruviana]
MEASNQACEAPKKGREEKGCKKSGRRRGETSLFLRVPWAGSRTASSTWALCNTGLRYAIGVCVVGEAIILEDDNSARHTAAWEDGRCNNAVEEEELIKMPLDYLFMVTSNNAVKRKPSSRCRDGTQGSAILPSAREGFWGVAGWATGVFGVFHFGVDFEVHDGRVETGEHHESRPGKVQLNQWTTSGQPVGRSPIVIEMVAARIPPGTKTQPPSTSDMRVAGKRRLERSRCSFLACAGETYLPEGPRQPEGKCTERKSAGAEARWRST